MNYIIFANERCGTAAVTRCLNNHYHNHIEYNEIFDRFSYIRGWYSFEEQLLKVKNSNNWVLKVLTKHIENRDQLEALLELDAQWICLTREPFDYMLSYLIAKEYDYWKYDKEKHVQLLPFNGDWSDIERAYQRVINYHIFREIIDTSVSDIIDVHYNDIEHDFMNLMCKRLGIPNNGPAKERQFSLEDKCSLVLNHNVIESYLTTRSLDV